MSLHNNEFFLSVSIVHKIPIRFLQCIRPGPVDPCPCLQCMARDGKLQIQLGRDLCPVFVRAEGMFIVIYFNQSMLGIVKIQ